MKGEKKEMMKGGSEAGRGRKQLRKNLRREEVKEGGSVPPDL